jgi:hypothetical protein
MINQLKNKQNQLRPFFKYTAVFDQNGSTAPILNKVLYNDFPKDIDIVWDEWKDPGVYIANIGNYQELGFLEHDVIAVETNIIWANTGPNKIQGILNEAHSLLTVINILLVFSSPNDIDGQFQLTLEKLKYI